MTTARLGRRAALAATTIALAAQASAATTYAVSGTQTVVDAAAGTARMNGGLIGEWANTSFTPLAAHPLWGACWHPVRGGTGAFAQATGVLVMADTPTTTGVATAYIGTINLRARPALRARRTARAAVASPGGAMGGCGPEG